MLFRWHIRQLTTTYSLEEALDRLHRRLHQFRATDLFRGNGKVTIEPAIGLSTEQRSASLAERAQHAVSTGEDLGVQSTRLSVEADEREAGRQHRTAADAVVRQGFVDAKADADADDAKASTKQEPTSAGRKLSMRIPPRSSARTNQHHSGDSPGDGSQAAYTE